MRGKRLPIALVAVLASCSSPSKPDENARDARASEPAEESCVCTLSREELAEREKWLASLSPGVEAVADLPDGFEVTFKGTPEWSKRIFELVSKERSCCSSLVFELRLEPESGPILLRVRGAKDATDFLKARLTPSSLRRP